MFYEYAYAEIEYGTGFKTAGFLYLLFRLQGHLVGIHELVQLIFRNQSLFKHQVADVCAGFNGFLGQMAGFGVADDGAEGGDDADRMLYEFAAMLFVCCNSLDAVDAQRVHALGERMEGLEQLVEDDRLKGVKLELSAFRRHGDGCVISDDVESDLVHDLGNDGVDLARHDGGAVLARGQVDLAKARSGAGGHEAQIVGNLGKVDCAGFKRAGQGRIYIQILRAVHEVTGLNEHFVGELCNQGYDALDVGGAGVYARADCRAAEEAKARCEEIGTKLETKRSALRSAEEELLSAGMDVSESPVIARAKAETAFVQQQLARKEGEIAAMGDPMVMGTRLESLESRRDELLEQYEALEMAISTLREANDEMQQRFAPELGRRAGEIMARLTGGKYAALSFSRELDASAKREGDTVAHEKAFLSEGTADQLYLALRLAICELALPESSSCPIILDDALVNFDDERMAYALEFLEEMAEKRQIILFSCHDREEKFLKNR